MSDEQIGSLVSAVNHVILNYTPITDVWVDAVWALAEALNKDENHHLMNDNHTTLK